MSPTAFRRNSDLKAALSRAGRAGTARSRVMEWAA
jgi:hypothetical protein